MKLWRAYTIDPHDGTIYRWAGDAKAACEARRELERDGYTNPTGIEAVDIPTSKAGLIGWLNDNFTTDNG